jgi:hypothetical protein
LLNKSLPQIELIECDGPHVYSSKTLPSHVPGRTLSNWLVRLRPHSPNERLGTTPLVGCMIVLPAEHVPFETAKQANKLVSCSQRQRFSPRPRDLVPDALQMQGFSASSDGPKSGFKLHIHGLSVTEMRFRFPVLHGM